jgi:tetratricopeptide (TPR) repeat protein
MKSQILQNFILILFFTLIFNSAKAQSSLPKNVNDSLWGLWNNQLLPDSIRAEALGNFAKGGYIFTQPDSAIYYLNILKKFAVKRSLKSSEAFAINNIGVAAWLKSDFETALSFFEEALDKYAMLGNKIGIANANSNIGMIYSIKGDNGMARQFSYESNRAAQRNRVSGRSSYFP